MKVLLVPNFHKEHTPECLHDVLRELCRLGITAYIDAGCRSRLPAGEPVVFCDFIAEIGNMDLLIAIGGDGTIIHAAKHAVKHGLPVLGVNAGRMGFLAQLEAGHLGRLSKLAEGDYTVTQRMMVEAHAMTDSGVQAFVALNDIVLTKADLARIVDIEVSCGGSVVSTYHADGVIFSSPTGSTAYALSAGGPIVDPGLNCLSMTPICPHSLFARSVLFSAEQVLTARAKHVNTQNDLYLSADGGNAVKLKPGCPVKIMRSKLTAKLVDFGDSAFYEVLNEKILGRGKTDEV